MYVLNEYQVVRAKLHQNPVGPVVKLRLHKIRPEHLAADAEVEVVVPVVAGEQRDDAHGWVHAEQPL